MKFLPTNPYTTIKNLKSDLADAEEYRDNWRTLYWEIHGTNDAHRELNGKLRADIDNLEAEASKQGRYIDYLEEQNWSQGCRLDELLIQAPQDERAIFAHMEEREYLLDTIEDLDGEANDLVDGLIYLSKETSGLLDTIASKEADIKMLNGLLVEGSQSYDKVVEAGDELAAEYEQLMGAHDDTVASLMDLKTSQTQSLSWVRQAEQALQDYGITIDDTPVGPAVQIDRDTFVNRVALDNVTAAPV